MTKKKVEGGESSAVMTSAVICMCNLVEMLFPI